MHFYTFVLKNLFRRRVRSLLTAIGVAVAVGAVVALVGISTGFESSFLELYQKRNTDIVVSRKGLMDRLTSGLDDRMGDQILQLNEKPALRNAKVKILHACGGLIDQIPLEKIGALGVLVQGWPAGSYLLGQLNIRPGGRILEAGDTHGVLVGRMLAANLKKERSGKQLGRSETAKSDAGNVEVGDSVTILDETFKIVGIYESFSVYENGMMIMLLDTLQRLQGREHQVTGYTVFLDKHDKDAVKLVCDQINALDKTGRTQAMPATEFVQSTTQIQAAQAMAWMTSAVAVVIGAVGMLNTMVMSVFERTREIGILRAIGWRRGRVVKMILMESVLLSIGGGIIGTVSALLLIHFLSSLPSVSGLISGNISWTVIGQGFMIALLVGLIGAAYPAYRGAQLLPTEAIRHE
jgi:putative ABC transport system permease protein